ncbi:DNA polymerase IV [Clostridium tepidiprofundi DSM 19306]|uniref:DNA polymerase IV n=2 Tax=Clostridium TaxID=1485 RepID=A0A151B4I8_9CLOT|nr:DNA polymerase IV [Clostridium tepidiprofundi DSM 19306]
MSSTSNITKISMKNNHTNKNKIIFHIDVNSAYLSWTAIYKLQHGSKLDLREIPSIIGGNPKSRHGIVLAKSIPAKKYKIQTGESLFSAMQKYPKLIVEPPNYSLYLKNSNAMLELLKEYTPIIQKYSIDECFLDFTNMDNLYPDYVKLAHSIKERIKNELGFTVNIGISSNKLLAKMASDFKKPDNVHTLFPNEIKKKMWQLPIEDLFMVGRATAPKLRKININTIGDLANYDINLLKIKFKSNGILMWNYANGIDESEVIKSNHINMKSVGNSTTTPFNIENKNDAHMVILSLSETVGMRLRNSENCCSLVSISIKNSDFISYSHQRKLFSATDSTQKIAETACKLFDEIWKGEPIRLIGVSVSELCSNDFYQTSIFENGNVEKIRKLDKTIDSIRLKYGSNSIVRSVFLHSDIKPLTGSME